MKFHITIKNDLTWYTHSSVDTCFKITDTSSAFWTIFSWNYGIYHNKYFKMLSNIVQSPDEYILLM